MCQFFRPISLLISLIAVLSLLGCLPPKPKPAKFNYLTQASAPCQGLQVVQQGSRLLVMISTDAFFDPPTTSLKPTRVVAVAQLAQSIFNFTTLYPYSIVYVRGYTDTFFPPYTRLTLSQQYADVIAAYLWNAGIPTANIRAMGYDGAYAIANQHTVRGMGFNRRVEIQIN